MAPRQEVPRRPAPRLYLVTPTVDDAGAQARALTLALGAGDIAAVLLRLPPAGERDLINHIKVIAPVVQGQNAALLLDGRADIVARAGADGAHLTGFEAFSEARGGLQPARIAGVGSLETRHDAMLAAEAGADYVMFGEPGVDGHRPAFAGIVERVAWWSEVFEIPCVGYAADLEEVTALALAGADFVALGDFVWNHGSDPAAIVASAAGRLHPVEFV
jgi:thiamine-phosphate pyrophosphorylase